MSRSKAVIRFASISLVCLTLISGTGTDAGRFSGCTDAASLSESHPKHPASTMGKEAYSDKGVTVFERGMDGYGYFRIPAIVKARDGSLIAFAEGRRNGLSDAGDIDLVYRRSFDEGATWGPLLVVWDDGGNTCGNPSPVVLENGRILMVMSWNLGTDKERDIERMRSEDTRKVYVTYSDDNGESWSAPVEITSQVKQPGWGWFACGPCHALQKARSPRKGRVIIPSNHSELDSDGEPCSRSQVIYSDDEGETWSIGAVSCVSGNECSAAELSDGSIYLTMRHTDVRDSVRLFAVSRDGGESFSEQGRSSLVEPICQGSVLGLSEGGKQARSRSHLHSHSLAEGSRNVSKSSVLSESDSDGLRKRGDNSGGMNSKKRGKASGVLYFCNPSDSHSRVNLCLQRSFDVGATWETVNCVHEGPAAYSDIVELMGGTDGSLGTLGSGGKAGKGGKGARQEIGVLYENGEGNNPYLRISFKKICIKQLEVCVK